MSRWGWNNVHSLIASIASVEQAYISPVVRTIFTILNPWFARRYRHCARVRSRPVIFRIIVMSIAIATGLSLGSSGAIFSTTSGLFPGICTTAKTEVGFLTSVTGSYTLLGNSDISNVEIVMWRRFAQVVYQEYFCRLGVRIMVWVSTSLHYSSCSWRCVSVG